MTNNEYEKVTLVVTEPFNIWLDASEFRHVDVTSCEEARNTNRGISYRLNTGDKIKFNRGNDWDRCFFNLEGGAEFCIDSARVSDVVKHNHLKVIHTPCIVDRSLAHLAIHEKTQMCRFSYTATELQCDGTILCTIPIHTLAEYNAKGRSDFITKQFPSYAKLNDVQRTRIENTLANYFDHGYTAHTGVFDDSLRGTVTVPPHTFRYYCVSLREFQGGHYYIAREDMHDVVGSVEGSKKAIDRYMKENHLPYSYMTLEGREQFVNAIIQWYRG